MKMITATSALIFTVLTGMVIIFQACLAAGLPWGAASMGGKFPGRYPVKMRFTALFNILLLLIFIAIVVTRAGMTGPVPSVPYPQILIWIVVVFSLMGTVLNIITPSRIERIWAPVALGQFVTSLLVALG